MIHDLPERQEYKDEVEVAAQRQRRMIMRRSHGISCILVFEMLSNASNDGISLLHESGERRTVIMGPRDAFLMFPFHSIILSFQAITS